MCSIAGAIGHIDRRVLGAVTRIDAAQVHRGPDAKGMWSSLGAAEPDAGENGVILAHRRLAIIDLSPDGCQPMVANESGMVIVFNGEIYNFRELRAQLVAVGKKFRTSGDTEVILRAHEHWGMGAVERLRGMFAYALWEPEARRVVLVRDRLGIKPLYYVELEDSANKRTVLFSSELRAILASDLIERRLDPVGLSSYIWNGFVPGPQTIIEHVKILPPGTTATVLIDRPCVLQTAYWQLPRLNGSITDTRRLSEALNTAARQHLISDVPSGVFLSGGIDSSAIAALAVRNADSPGDIRTFNIGFGEDAYDESQHARRVAAALGTEHHELCLTEEQFISELTRALDSIDQPTFDGINTYIVSKLVKEAGITVALAGTGGDELFGGYRSFVDLPKYRPWAQMLGFIPKEVRRALGRRIIRLKTGPARNVPPQTRWGKLPDAMDSRGQMLELYQVAYGLFTREFTESLTDERLMQKSYAGLPHGRAENLRGLISDQDDLHAVSLLELSLFLGDRLLRDTDAASMAVAVEVRVPLLDHEVVEAVAGLSRAVRFSPIGQKQLLRRMVFGEDMVAMFDRPKSGFVLPIDQWCRRGLKEDVSATLNNTRLCNQVGLNPKTVAVLWKEFQAGAPGLYWTRIWSLYVLLRWCEKYRATI